jgi:putative copper export protein
VGGLIAFLWAPDRRFGRYAAWTLGIAAVSGLLLAFAHTGFGPSVVTSEYGRVLLIKVCVVAAALVAIAFRRRRLELGLVVGAVAAAAVLAALPPPR